MSTAQNPIRLFETVVDQCPYLEDQRSGSILVDPDHQIDQNLFSLLSRSGFRRSGEMLYAPKCPNCKACVSVRIPTELFTPSRSQKRVIKKNSDLRIEIEDVSFEQAHFDLYLRYQKHRHPDSSMCDEDQEKYIGFIESSYAESKFMCFYADQQLIGISVLDQFKNGISAVYTFFEPEHDYRSLGTYAIISAVSMAAEQNVPYVYLGYWVDGSEKMNYKRNFKPLEGYKDRRWVALDI